MTNKLVVIINSLKVAKKNKKILLYEVKFLVPNYSCLQNHWLGGYRPPDPRSLCPLSSTEFVEPPSPPEQNSWVRHCLLQSQCFIHSLVSVRVPRIGALPRNGATTYSHHPRSPKQTEGLHKMQCGLVPQGDRLPLLWLPQCHASFSTVISTLARLNQSPDSQGVS